MVDEVNYRYDVGFPRISVSCINYSEIRQKTNSLSATVVAVIFRKFELLFNPIDFVENSYVWHLSAFLAVNIFEWPNCCSIQHLFAGHYSYSLVRPKCSRCSRLHILIHQTPHTPQINVRHSHSSV